MSYNKTFNPISEFLLPTTTVGSFGKPDYLVKARQDFYQAKIKKVELRKLEERATQEFIDMQERVGLDVLVDGEAERGDMATFFAEKLDGFKISEPVRSYGNRYYKKPIIVSEIKFREPLTEYFFTFTQQRTRRPVKGILTGPYTLMDWSFDEFYGSREKVVAAFAAALRLEVQALIQAGCKIIQIDEPALSARTDEIDLAIDGLKQVLDGFEIYSITHICYGAFEALVPRIPELPVKQIDLEFAGRNFELLEQLKGHPFPQDVGLGIFDVHTRKIKTRMQILEGLMQALLFFELEQIWVDPDCGLKTRTLAEAEKALREMVTTVKSLRVDP